MRIILTVVLHAFLLRIANKLLITAKDLKNTTAIKNRTDNHFVRKQTLNHLVKLTSLAKWLSVRLRTMWV